MFILNKKIVLIFFLFMSKLILPMQDLLVENQNQFFKLPDELVVKIFTNLLSNGTNFAESLELLDNVRLTCRRFNILAHENIVINYLVNYFLLELKLKQVHLKLVTTVKSMKKWDNQFLLALLENLDSESLNKKDKNGDNVFMIALWRNYIPVIELLFKKNIDFNALNDRKQNALIIAVIQNNVNVVRELLSKDVNVNFKDINEKNALRYAADKNNIELVDLLLESTDDFRFQEDYKKFGTCCFISKQGLCCELGATICNEICPMLCLGCCFLACLVGPYILWAIIDSNLHH